MKFFSSLLGNLLKKNSEVLWLLLFFLVVSYKYSLTVGIISLVILYLFLLQAVYLFSNLFRFIVGWFNCRSFSRAWREEYCTSYALADLLRIVSMIVLAYTLELGNLIMLGIFPAIPLSLIIVFWKNRKA